MSEMRGKITFFLLIWNLKIVGVNQETKKKQAQICAEGCEGGSPRYHY
jgi:hypothetical protein